MKGFKALRSEFEALGIDVLWISADPPEVNQRFRTKLDVWGELLSDVDHAVADRYGVPISRKHPKALSYTDGFIQPAVFAFRKDREVFQFVQTPKALNLWGAARRPTPQQVLDAIRAAWEDPDDG